MECEAKRQKPWFESVAIEVLRDQNLQLKLTAWDKKKQEDVLKVFTPYELRKFEGYESYHECHLKIMRAIFERHHEGIRKGLPLTQPPADWSERPSRLQRLYNGGIYKPIRSPCRSYFNPKGASCVLTSCSRSRGSV
jgi:hypothetical protein